MTTNNYINTGKVTSSVYSVTPEIDDNLAQGAIYQTDLQTQGAPVGNALGYYKSSLTTFGTPDRTFPYPLAAPKTGPLLRQIQGSDGYRYLLSRFDGILFANADPATNPLASPATYCYPVASTDGVNPVVIGCRLAVDSSNGTYTTYPIYPGALTTESPFTYLIVGVSDGITDSIAQTTPSINTFGGFCLYLGNNNLPVPPPQPKNPTTNPVTYGVFNVYSTPATFIVPQDFVNGNPNVPAYGKPSKSGTVTNYYYNITVGDYVWLQVGSTPGSVSSPVSSPAVTSKSK